MSARKYLAASALLVVATVNAQQNIECDGDEGWWRWRGGRTGHACDVRELTLPAPARLAVDAGTNGSIEVTGEIRSDVQVRAVVQAWADSDDDAARIVSEVEVRSTDAGVLLAEGPDRRGRTGWSVSYRVRVPRDMNLMLATQNGGIEVAAVRGDLNLEAHNGGIGLDGVAGNVRGRTTNGGVEAELTGRTWDGAGLDLETTNGGVRLRIPDGYAARLETRTVNGNIDIDFPVTVQGRIGRELSTTLGEGGPLVRAETTNGQVRLTRGRGDLSRLP
jgi:hypothetical protein